MEDKHHLDWYGEHNGTICILYITELQGSQNDTIAEFELCSQGASVDTIYLKI